jgi:hypothetical protein
MLDLEVTTMNTHLDVGTRERKIISLTTDITGLDVGIPMMTHRQRIDARIVTHRHVERDLESLRGRAADGRRWARRCSSSMQCLQSRRRLGSLLPSKSGTSSQRHDYNIERAVFGLNLPWTLYAFLGVSLLRVCLNF